MPAKKTTKSESKGKGRVVLTNDALVVTLTAENRRAMQACLKKSGKIVLQLKQVEVTTLPGVGNLTVEPISD
jgi:hypothetical protein